MSIERGGLWRSLFSSVRRSRGDRDQSAARRISRRRFQSIERLEQRAMMTTTVFVDFGEGLNTHLLTTVGELRRDLFGPDIRTPFTDDTILEIAPLRDAVFSLGIDFNDDGRAGDLNDYVALRNATMEIVRRQFAPFDVNVEVAAAANTQQIKNYMARNGTGVGNADAYVMAHAIYEGLTGIPPGTIQGWLGIASGVDLIQTTHNVTDEAVLVDGEFMLNTAQFSGWNYAVAMAHVISHEALHTLSERHINSGAILGGPLGADQDMLTQSELITEGGGSFLNVENASFITRYPLMMGDGNVNQGVLRNPFDIMALEVGLRPGAPQQVTGTGAFDRITVTRVDSNRATVTVEPFRDATFAAGSRITIGTGGVFSYDLFGISNGIVIDGGRGVDQIFVDARLSVPVTVRGGQGFDQLHIVGAAAPISLDAMYKPDTNYRFIPGNETYSAPFLNDLRNYVSYSGTVVAGPTQIRYEEFDDGGSINFDQFGSVLFSGSEGFDNVTINSPAAGINEVNGVIGGVGFPNLRYANTRSVAIDTGASAVTDAVTINALNATGLMFLTVNTGAGGDFINVNTGSLQTAVPGGGVNLNFGSGADTLNASGNVDWTLNDVSLQSSLGGIATLQGLQGEHANLVGGANGNLFNVSNWNGTGGLVGNGGADSVNITRDTNFIYGENFVHVSGGGRFSLGSMEFLNLTGGPSSNTFLDVGWTGRGTLDGGLSTGDAADMIATLRDSHVSLGDTFYRAGNNIFTASMSLADVELASLTGGPGFNQFDVSGRTTPAAINGGGGVDIVVHNKDVNYTLINNMLSVSSGLGSNFFTLANIEVAHLTGGASANTFTISQWAGSGFMVGGAGDDTFNISTGSLDAVTGPWNILGGIGAGDIIKVNDSLGGVANYIISPNGLTIAPGSFRRFGGVFYDGATERLELSASNAANRIDVTPSLGTEFFVDGNLPGAPFGDALVVHTTFSGPPSGLTSPMTFPGFRDVIFAEIEQVLTAP